MVKPYSTVAKNTEIAAELKAARQQPEAGADRPQNSLVDHILFLQRTAGNRAVERLLRSGMIQAKLEIGQPDDLYERNADEVAERVMKMPEPAVQLQSPNVSPLIQCQANNELEEPLQLGMNVGEEEKTPLQSKAQTDQAPRITPQLESTIDSFQNGGEPLDERTRAFFEPRFGHDFSRVRVHTDSNAAETARAVNALAYTVGNHVVFDRNRYAPDSSGGKQLLAHELAHVIQQTSGPSPRRIQGKPGEKKAGSGPRVTQFKIIVNRDMSADELIHEFVRQYYSCTTEAQIQAKLPIWVNLSKRGTTPAEVKRGYVIARVTSLFETDPETLNPEEKAAINAEADRRFRETTGSEPGKKTGNSAKDKERERVRQGILNAVLTEDKQRKEIEALPEDIKKVLFSGGPGASAVTAENYTRVLIIAGKLAKLTPEQRKDYLARINASTSSLDELESSIDNYIKFLEQRELESQKNEAAAKPLFGAEDLYTLYKNYKACSKNLSLAKSLKSLAHDKAAAADSIDYLEQMLRETETALLAELKRKDFDSISDFEAALETYRTSFRTQAVNLALDVLARYEHMLFEEKKKFSQPGAAAAVVQGIAGTRATELYKSASKKSLLAIGVSAGDDPMGHDADLAQSLRDESKAEHAQAESDVIKASGNDPLVGERGTDREKLSGLDADQAQKYLLEVIEKRAGEVRTARQEFREDPDRVFNLPDLIAASIQIQGVDPDSIYGRIVKDYIDSEKLKHIVSAIAVGILAIALAFLVPGGGWVAAAALVANAGISTYQAYTAYKEYQQDLRAFNLHFISEEPSLFWVGVAIAGAAIDLGIATGVVLKQSATALKALEGPMVEFSKDGDLARLVAKIEAADLQKALKIRLEEQAKASLAAAKEQFKEAVGMVAGNMGCIAGDGWAVVPGFRALYYSIKRGVNTIAKLRADAKFVGMVGEITRMSGAERAQLEAAFEEVKQLVKVGQAKSMDEASLLGYIDRWALNRGKPGLQAKLLEEMKLWKPLTAEQRQALDALKTQKGIVERLYELKAQAEKELAELRAKQVKDVEDIEEIRELEAELTKYDPINYPPKPGTKKGIGKIAEEEKKLAEKEVEAAKAQLTLYDRIRAAAPSDAAKERALKGVAADQVGPLKTKPTPLQADHIVSVREICDMDGFADLPWKDQKAIVDMKDNLVAMDGAANASKNDRSWRSWSQASNYYGNDTIEAMARHEAHVRSLIQNEIKNRLAKLPRGGK